MADTEKLIVELGVKDAGTSKQLSAINKELKGLDREYKSANNTSKDFEKSQEGLKSKLTYLQKAYDLNATKLETYKKKTTDAIKKQEEKISKMKLEGQDTSKAEEQLQRMKNTLNDTARQARITENEMKGLNNTIDETNASIKANALGDYKNKLKQLGESCGTTSEKLKDIGSTTSNIGGNILKATAPMVALGTVATKMATDWETSFAKVTTIADENEVSNEKMKKSIMDLSNQTGISANEIANNVYDAISAGQKTGDAVNFVSNSTKLAKAGFAEAGDSLNLLTTIMNSYGLEASKVTDVSDKLITTQNIGKTTVAELSQSMGKVIPTAKAVGVNLDNVATSYALLTAKGIATSEAGTYVSSMLNELGKQGTIASNTLKEVSGKTFQELINEGKSLGDILAIMDEGAKKSGKSLLDCFGSAEAGKAGMVIATNAGKDYNNMLLQMADSAGATQKAFDKMDNTRANKMAKSVNEAKNEMIRLGETLLPMLDEVSNAIGVVTEWFGKMTVEQQQAIVKATLITTVFGGTLKVVGGLTTGLGSLVGGIGKVSTALGGLGKTATVAKNIESVGSASKIASVGFSGLSSAILPVGVALATVGAAVYTYKQEQESLSKSVITSKEELGLLQSTLLELNGVHAQNREELEKSGLVYKELSGNIRGEFKQALEESTADVHNFAITLNEISLDNVLDDGETTAFNTRIENCVSSALESINSKKNEAQQSMQSLFTIDDSIIDESEQKIIELCTKEYETEAEEVKKNQDAITQIYNAARAENRTLKPEEIQQIKQYYANIKQIELECKAENNDELQANTIDFNNRIKNLDAQGASELLQQKKKEIDEQVIQKENQYDLLIAKAEEGASKLTGAEKQEADQQIQNLKDKKQQCIDEYQGQWQKYQEIIETEAPAIADKVNKYNGEILSNADMITQQGLEKMKAHYDGLDQVTKEGWYKIKDTTDGSITDCYMTVDKNTGEITACYNKTTGEIAGYTDSMKKDVESLAEQHEVDRLKINTAMGQIANAHVNTKNQIVGADGQIIGSLDKVKTSADGVKTGIVNINGTPMQIKTNADGVITEMTTVTDKVKAIPEKKDVTINFFQKGLDWIKQKWDSIGNKNVKVDANANGTYSSSGGLSTVDEKGWELASNNSVQVLGTYASNTLTSIPSGTAISTHMQSVQDMKYAVSEEVRKAMLNYSKKNNNDKSNSIDYEKLANVMLNVFTQSLGNININNLVAVDANGIAKNTINILNRQDKNSRISKGVE